jgi:hypothetical protein
VWPAGGGEFRQLVGEFSRTSWSRLEGEFARQNAPGAKYPHAQPGWTVQPPRQANGCRRLRNFNSSFTLLLRDGQTAQVSSATDPISGEVLKVVVTLNVVK